MDTGGLLPLWAFTSLCRTRQAALTALIIQKHGFAAHQAPSRRQVTDTQGTLWWSRKHTTPTRRSPPEHGFCVKTHRPVKGWWCERTPRPFCTPSSPRWTVRVCASGRNDKEVKNCPASSSSGLKERRDDSWGDCLHLRVKPWRSEATHTVMCFALFRFRGYSGLSLFWAT